jgi:hypothetical protein
MIESTIRSLNGPCSTSDSKAAIGLIISSIQYLERNVIVYIFKK